jgi:hypothetical protein
MSGLCSYGWIPGRKVWLGIELIEQFTNVAQLRRGDFLRPQCLQDEVAHRAIEEPVHQIADELLLGFLGRNGGLVNVAAFAVLALDEAFLRHDLQKAEDRGVGERRIALGIDRVQNFADGAGSAFPEHAQDG